VTRSWMARTGRRWLLGIVPAAACWGLLIAGPAKGGEGDAYGVGPMVWAGEAAVAQPPAAKPSPGVKKEPLPTQPLRPAPFAPEEPFIPPPAPRSPLLDLASVPNMFGDAFNQGGQLEATGYDLSPLVDLPLAGAARRIKIAENNKALPMDRVYFMYNHFHNALEANPDVNTPGLGRGFSVDRYTLGLEKTLRDGLWSIDLRMPFCGSYRVAAPDFAASGGEIGNLSLAAKRLLFATEGAAGVLGLAVDTPTGSNATGFLDTTSFVVHNDAVHLAPFLGLLLAPNDDWFCHAFLQIDVPASGNRVDLTEGNPGQTTSLGRLHEQTLMYLDVSAGYWILRNPQSTLSGLAALVEFHHTTTQQDADLVSGATSGAAFTFGNLLNRVDVPNLTVGLHAEINGRSELRVGGVFPLNDPPERAFDAELQISFNRRF